MDHDVIVALVPVIVLAIGTALWRIVNGYYVPRSTVVEMKTQHEKETALALAAHNKEMAALEKNYDRAVDKAEKYETAYRDKSEAYTTLSMFWTQNMRTTEAVLPVLSALQQPGVLAPAPDMHGGT